MDSTDAEELVVCAGGDGKERGSDTFVAHRMTAGT